jgi:SAM-dependent methyltransferase
LKKPEELYEDDRRSIKFFVKRYLLQNQDAYSGKKIIDFPAGNGITSKILRDIGAEPIPFDLFPEYFTIEGMECKRASIANGIPLEDHAADGLICQEGIEHFSDQLGALKEFNRVLKHDSLLLITTPNHSNLRAKLSHVLFESERSSTKMPPNELDSIWMANRDITPEIYYGHIFLIGIQKLRVLAKLAGFRIRRIHFTRVKSTSVFLFLFLYPFILITSWLTYKRNMRRNSDYNAVTKRQVYGEILNLAVNPGILVGGNLMVEFIKEKNSSEVGHHLRGKHKEFGRA